MKKENKKINDVVNLITNSITIITTTAYGKVEKAVHPQYS